MFQDDSKQFSIDGEALRDIHHCIGSNIKTHRGLIKVAKLYGCNEKMMAYLEKMTSHLLDRNQICLQKIERLFYEEN